MYRIARREQFSENSFLWEIDANDVAQAAQPGHFVMLCLREGGERIPMTVADFDRERGTVTVVVQALGKTTREMRDGYCEGDSFDEFVGPLGVAQHIADVGHVVLVGGGLGVAPVFPQLRAFKQAGNRTTCIVGFRSKDLAFWGDELAAWSDELVICTDDGSAGRPGLVTDALAELLTRERPDLVIAIGPMPMMRACTETTRPHGVRTLVSLNTIMVDGTGMCGSCRVSVGGVLRYGIPSFRLPRDIIEREVARLADLGVRFETNKVIGKTFTVEKLKGAMGFDAVFIAAGAGAPAFLGIPGEFAGQVFSANEFLTRVNLMGGDQFPYRDTPIGLGDKVVVIGAGNTAMDCLRVAKRLGAASVRCVYRRSEAEAPARVEELRHAREEGIEFSFLHAPASIELNGTGDVRAIRVQKMALGDPDERGRRAPVPLGEFIEWECDTVIYALGTKANPIVGRATKDLELNKWGYIVADDTTQATNLPGVFAGGDIVTSGATVILAMSAGRRAARAIAAYLASSGDDWPPSAAAIAAFVPRAALAEATP